MKFREWFGRKDEIPFEFGKKIGEGHNAQVFEAKGDKDHLIKKLQIRIPYYPEPKVTSKFDEQTFREHYQRNLMTLREKFGQYMPDIQLVFGKDKNGDTTGYLITERVIEDRETDNPENLGKLDVLLADIVDNYVENTLKKREENKKDRYDLIPLAIAVPDFIGPKDVIYGHTSTSPEPKYYLPDIYPMPEIRPTEMLYHIQNRMSAHPKFDFPITNDALTRLQKLVDDEGKFLRLTSL